MSHEVWNSTHPIREQGHMQSRPRMVLLSIQVYWFLVWLLHCGRSTSCRLSIPVCLGFHQFYPGNTDQQQIGRAGHTSKLSNWQMNCTPLFIASWSRSTRRINFVHRPGYTKCYWISHTSRWRLASSLSSKLSQMPCSNHRHVIKMKFRIWILLFMDSQISRQASSIDRPSKHANEDEEVQLLQHRIIIDWLHHIKKFLTGLWGATSLCSG